MTMPEWSLLAFATWTVLLLILTVGVYRWTRILTARAGLADFRGGVLEGDGWYQRATRAHLNCIENLPVFGAIVYAISASGATGIVVDTLALSVPVARCLQSVVHISFVQTHKVVGVRFFFFSVQLIAFLALIGMVVVAACH